MLHVLSRRLTFRQGSAELSQIERILAFARLVLAAASLLAFYLDPEPFPASSAVAILLLLYAAHSIALLIFLFLRRDLSPASLLTVHVADVLWPALIGIFTNGPHSPFFSFFVFALLAAAFRWGMNEAILTMLLAIGIVMTQALLLTWAPLARLVGGRLDVSALVMRTVYLVILGLLIGYLAESEKRRRAEVIGASQLATKARVDVGLKGTLQATMDGMLQLFGAREIVLVAHEADNIRGTLWRAERSEQGAQGIFSFHQVDQSALPDYFFGMSKQAAAWRKGRPLSVAIIDDNGNDLQGTKLSLPPGFIAEHPFELLLATTVSVAADLSCSVFMFDARFGGRAKTQLRIFGELANRVAPAIYNVYLLRRLRSRAAAVERARVARELHDGVVQSLHALAFRMYALRTSSALKPAELEQELLDMQEILQKEASNLRNLIQQLRPAEFDPRHLLDFLTSMVERFRYDTGISAKFVCDVANVSLAPRACREIAAIVQESLANTLKHSGAEHVMVRLSSTPDDWVLTVDDDGRGFEFTGRYSHNDLENMRRGPAVIKQRARAVGGELTIDSRAGQGARLEIRIPKAGVAILV